MDYIQLCKSRIEEEAIRTAPSIQAPRTAALEQFQHLGLPTKKNEKYKYTDLNAVFAKDYLIDSSLPKLPFDLRKECGKHLPSIDAYFVYTLNGILVEDTANVMVQGLSLSSLASAATQQADWFKTHYNVLAGSMAAEDALTALNTAFAPEGLLLHLAPNVRLDKTLVIVNAVYGEQAHLSQQRNLFVFEENSEAKIMTLNISLSDAPSLSNNLTEVLVGNAARIELVRLQSECEQAALLASDYVKQADTSYFNYASVVLGGALVVNSISVHFAGEHCENHLYGLVVADKNQHVDNYTFVDHAVPNCESSELYKSVLDGQSVNVFNGRILVRRDAQKTLAFQSNRNIVLSNTAKMYTKPQLEIYADDVKCSHGATIGQLDNEELFYMQTRGIGLAEARLLLMVGFANEVLQKIGSTEIQDILFKKVEERMK